MSEKCCGRGLVLSHRALALSLFWPFLGFSSSDVVKRDADQVVELRQSSLETAPLQLKYLLLQRPEF